MVLSTKRLSSAPSRLRLDLVDRPIVGLVWRVPGRDRSVAEEDVAPVHGDHVALGERSMTSGPRSSTSGIPARNSSSGPSFGYRPGG